MRLAPFVCCLCFLVPASGFASAFRIPNQSTNALSLATAYIASPRGADAAYYNPANMSWNENLWAMELSLNSIYLPSIAYEDSRTPLLDAESESELFLLPLLHLASRDYQGFRFGFSLTHPFGLSKRWDSPQARAQAEEFSLLTFEANPSVSYRINNHVSLAGGVRMLYGDGTVKNSISNPPFEAITPLSDLSRNMEGDGIGWGYNLALSVRPHPHWNIALTYRSKIDIDLEGDAQLRASAGGYPVGMYNADTSLELVTPAVLALASSFRFQNVLIELAWDRTFWSDFKTLDFDYNTDLGSSPFAVFDLPQPKNWEDSDAFRLGLTFTFNDQWTSRFGIAYDTTPIPDATLGFELPDNDALNYGLGLSYKFRENWRLAAAYLLYQPKERRVINTLASGEENIYGNFSDGGAHVINCGVSYSF